MLDTRLLDFVALQPWLNALVLRIEGTQVRNKVLDNMHVRQGVNLVGILALFVDVSETGEAIGTIDIHRAAATNTLTTGSAQCKYIGQGVRAL